MPLTDDEKKRVKPFFGEFEQYQAEGAFVDFWPKVHKAYFDVFPPSADVSEEVQAEALAKKETVHMTPSSNGVHSIRSEQCQLFHVCTSLCCGSFTTSSGILGGKKLLPNLIESPSVPLPRGRNMD